MTLLAFWLFLFWFLTGKARNIRVMAPGRSTHSSTHGVCEINPPVSLPRGGITWLPNFLEGWAPHMQSSQLLIMHLHQLPPLPAPLEFLWIASKWNYLHINPCLRFCSPRWRPQDKAHFESVKVSRQKDSENCSTHPPLAEVRRLKHQAEPSARWGNCLR